MPTTKSSKKRNPIDNLKQYDAKVISAQNCLKLLLNHKATPKFKEIVWKMKDIPYEIKAKATFRDTINDLIR